jgi:hypothetical protein
LSAISAVTYAEIVAVQNVLLTALIVAIVLGITLLWYRTP